VGMFPEIICGYFTHMLNGEGNRLTSFRYAKLASPPLSLLCSSVRLFDSLH
jgi:hypothetical protein